MVFLSEAIEGLGTAAAENAGTTIIAADFRQSVNMVMVSKRLAFKLVSAVT